MSNFLNDHVDIACPICGAFFFEHLDTCPEVALLCFLEEELWFKCPLPFCLGWLELNTEHHHECRKCSSQFANYDPHNEERGDRNLHFIRNRRSPYDPSFQGECETGVVVQLLPEKGLKRFLFDEICLNIQFGTEVGVKKYITYNRKDK